MSGIALLGLAVMLGGCAGSSDSLTDAFVDPSIYDLYDCKQLAAERTSLAHRLAENQKLIDKARTGVAGDAVAAVAYGNQDVSLRGQIRLAERVWQRDRCDSSGIDLAPAIRVH